MSYLAPLQLYRGALPNEVVMRQYGLTVYADLTKALRRGDVGVFHATLASHERELARRHTYVLVERLGLLIYRRRLKLMYAGVGGGRTCLGCKPWGPAPWRRRRADCPRLRGRRGDVRGPLATRRWTATCA